MGNYQVGKFYQWNLSATSTFSQTIQYTVTGGWLPANLTLTPNQGVLQGFLDYDPVPREYRWQITANDGVNTQTQEYYITTYSVYSGQFVDFSLPVNGGLKLDLENQVVENYLTATDPVYPALNIISGITYNNSISQLLDPARQWLTDQHFVLGNLQVQGTTLWRNIYDNQQGADAVSINQPGGTMWPQSLDNLRRVWSSLGFVSDGYGTGARLQPVIDLEQGSFSSVAVVASGQGYRYPPLISATGTGNGVVLDSRLGVVSAQVTDSSNAWSVGNTFVFNTGIYDQAAVLEVTTVNSANYITSVSVVDPGLYSQTPIAPKAYQETNRSVSIQAQWGVVAVKVVEPGTGYQSTTTLDVTGQETLPQDQTTWSPQIFLSTVDTSVLAGKNDPLPGRVWHTNHLVLQTQGKSWQGSTSYDNDNTTWDGGSCTFQDWIQPSYTTWNQDATTWDDQLTTWDHSTFDKGTTNKFMQMNLDNMTWQQLYDSLYISDTAIYQSDTLVEWLIHLPNQVLSRENAVYTGNIALV